jgi:hypothetical protein
MAAKPKQEVTLTDDGREATVVAAPKTTFEERTAQGQPWRNEDGSENRGEVVESEPVVEETATE